MNIYKKIAGAAFALSFALVPLNAIMLNSSDGANEDYFSSTHLLSGENALIGAYYKNSNAGAAYLYRNISARTQSKEDLKLTASDSASGDYFSYTQSLSGENALVGAYNKNSGTGTAYLYHKISTRTQSKEDLKLIASDGERYDNFAYTLSLSGENALIGAQYNLGAGAAYLYNKISKRTKATEDLKLTASDSAQWDSFSNTLLLSGENALIGAFGNNSYKGAVYVYRKISKRTQSTEDLKLFASDGVNGDVFSSAMSLSGENALIGTYYKDNYKGAAYLYRKISTRTQSTEDLKLTASDGAEWDSFSDTLSLSGENALISAHGNNSNRGAAYLYRNVSARTQTTEDLKLISSDGAPYDGFSRVLSLSGENALISAYGKNFSRGTVYVYRNISTRTQATEDLKLTAHDAAEYDYFGNTLSLNGETALIGAYGKNSYRGAAYLVNIASMSTLDNGSDQTISQINFDSAIDWIVGENKSGNNVNLSSTAKATIAAGKAVYIGKNAGSNFNSLEISGKLSADKIYVGALGNKGNVLTIKNSADIADLAEIHISSGNSIDFGYNASVFNALGDTKLFIDGVLVNSENWLAFADSGEIVILDGRDISISTLPSDIVAAEGSSVLFNLEASSSSGNALKYKWEVLKLGAKNKNGSPKWTSASSSKPTLLLKKVSIKLNGAKYRCTITDKKAGIKVVSHPVLLTLQAKPKITANIANQIVYSNAANIVFKLDAVGENLIYKWEIDVDGKGKNWTTIGTEAELVLLPDEYNWSKAKIRCTVSLGDFPETKIVSKSAKITMRDAIEIDSSSFKQGDYTDQKVPELQEPYVKYDAHPDYLGTLKIALSKGYKPKYQWYLCGESFENPQAIKKATKASYTLPKGFFDGANDGDKKYLRCLVYNDGGSVNYDIVLTVKSDEMPSGLDGMIWTLSDVPEASLNGDIVFITNKKTVDISDKRYPDSTPSKAKFTFKRTSPYTAKFTLNYTLADKKLSFKYNGLLVSENDRMLFVGKETVRKTEIDVDVDAQAPSE